MRRVVIVGFGLGGMGTARHTVEFVEDAKVAVIGDEKPYVRHKLRLIPSGEDISVSTRHLESDGVEFLEDHVIKVRRDQKEVELRSGKRIKYDFLVLATGANPSSLRKVPGSELTYGFRKKSDVDLLVDKNPSRVAIIGASYVALHIADVARSVGAEPVVIVRSRLIRRSLEPEISAYLEEKLREHGVKFAKGSPKEVKENGVLLDSGDFVEADMVYRATGVSPEITLASKCGLDLHEGWVINVDRQGRTSDPNVFALGDAAIIHDPLTNKPEYAGIGTAATIMSFNVAKAISGSKMTLRIPRYQKDVFLRGIHMISIGWTSPEAEKQGFNPERVEMSGKPGWGEKSYVVYDKSTSQVIGFSGIATERNMIREKGLEVLLAMLRRKKVGELISG